MAANSINGAPLTDEENLEYRVERHKAMCEYLKFFITLSTGSIVLLATFLEKLFLQPEWKALVGVSLGGFIISVIAAVISYSFAVLHIGKHMSDSAGGLFVSGLLLSWVTFLVGIVSLAVFTLVNLF